MDWDVTGPWLCCDNRLIQPGKPCPKCGSRDGGEDPGRPNQSSLQENNDQ